jgi:ubiquinone/menaquinone biosynthesis C-methylase UbiE
MSAHVCPWWLGYFLASPLRSLILDPALLLEPHVRPGMTVLEPGPGMGFFTLELARQVGLNGHVIAVDIEPRMLRGLQRRAAKGRLLNRIELRQALPESLGVEDLAGTVDFVLAFAVVHELSAPGGFFLEATRALKSGGRLLLVEPSGHVQPAQFEEELQLATAAGLGLVERPCVRRSHAGLFGKP